ncbi:MAG: hypothetical protein ACC650_10390, partial [Gammaproteobacteria bacterium]
SGEMSKKDKERITASLLSLNDSRDGRSILKAAGMSGIRVAQDSDYDEHRQIIKRVLGETYVSAPEKIIPLDRAE